MNHRLCRVCILGASQKKSGFWVRGSKRTPLVSTELSTWREQVCAWKDKNVALVYAAVTACMTTKYPIMASVCVQEFHCSCNICNSAISTFIKCAVTGISIPLPWKVFWFDSPAPLEILVRPNIFLLKFWLSRPPIPLEFPLTFHGVGMDIFWNCTMFKKLCVLRFGQFKFIVILISDS